jgi:hypothetical protein
VSRKGSLELAVASLVVGLTLAACGSSSGGAPSAATVAPATAAAVTSTTTAPPPAAAGNGAATNCPGAAKVGSALGITVQKPTAIQGAGAALPAGSTGIACEYAGKSLNVLIEVLTNVDPSLIAQFSSKFPVPYTSVSGVGDQARAFSQTLGAGRDNEGVVATKGSKLVSIVATATPASLAQLEALVNQLL